MAQLVVPARSRITPLPDVPLAVSIPAVVQDGDAATVGVALQ